MTVPAARINLTQVTQASKYYTSSHVFVYRQVEGYGYLQRDIISTRKICTAGYADVRVSCMLDKIRDEV